MIDALIQELVVAFNSKKDVSAILKAINTDADSMDNPLNNWGCEKGFIDNFVFIVPQDYIPIPDDEEKISDYFNIEDLLFDNSSEIISFMKKQISSYLDEAISLHAENYQNSCISYECEIWGQAGPHYSKLNIFNNEADCHKHYIEQGYFLVNGDKILNSDSDIFARWNEFVKKRSNEFENPKS